MVHIDISPPMDRNGSGGICLFLSMYGSCSMHIFSRGKCYNVKPSVLLLKHLISPTTHYVLLRLIEILLVLLKFANEVYWMNEKCDVMMGLNETSSSVTLSLI